MHPLFEMVRRVLTAEPPADACDPPPPQAPEAVGQVALVEAPSVVRGQLLTRATRADLVRLQQAALAVALAELGNGEAGANNTGSDVVRYRHGVDDAGSWCAAFVAYCYETAAVHLNLYLPWKYRKWNERNLARSLGRLIGEVGCGLELPVPGSVLVWPRGTHKWQGHIEMVKSYERDLDVAYTVAANVGAFPSRITIRKYANGLWRRDLIAIYSCVPRLEA